MKPEAKLSHFRVTLLRKTTRYEEACMGSNHVMLVNAELTFPHGNVHIIATQLGRRVLHSHWNSAILLALR
eukprot:9484195-Pyramimonas_sp.AAC.3